LRIRCGKLEIIAYIILVQSFSAKNKNSLTISRR
jgi:hypothetical protein